MKTSEKVDKILPAIFTVKKELVAVSKSSDNPFFKSKYADLNTHLDEVEPRLEKVGCFLVQPVNSDNTVESRIIHVESGQWISSEMPLIVSKNTMQDAGSAVTYARRYTLGALLSMKAEDDDGEKTMGRSTPTKSYTPYVHTPVTKNNEIAKTNTTTNINIVTTEPSVSATQTLGTAEPFKKTTSFSKKKKPETATNNVAPVILTPPVTLATQEW